MRQFLIYHCIELDKTPNGTNSQPRKLVGGVSAESVNQAYLHTQNMNEKWKSRSTSIGDVIADGKDLYMVQGMGFRIIHSSELGIDKSDLYSLCIHRCDMMFVIVHYMKMLTIIADPKTSNCLVTLHTGNLKGCLDRYAAAKSKPSFGGIGLSHSDIEKAGYIVQEGENVDFDYRLN